MNDLPYGLENLITDKDQMIRFISAMLEMIKGIADGEMVLIDVNGKNKPYTEKEKTIDEYIFCTKTFRYIKKSGKK